MKQPPIKEKLNDVCPNCGKWRGPAHKCDEELKKMVTMSWEEIEAQRKASLDAMEAGTEWVCQRCGRCCMHMHSSDSGMPCESLLVKDGIAHCLREGPNKPEVCQNYPNHPDFGGEPCFWEKSGTRL